MMRFDKGAEIQLFVLDGCPCHICKIEGAMAQGVNTECSVLRWQWGVIRIRKKNLKMSPCSVFPFFACFNTRLFLFFNLMSDSFLGCIRKALSEARMGKPYTSRKARVYSNPLVNLTRFGDMMGNFSFSISYSYISRKLSRIPWFLHRQQVAISKWASFLHLTKVSHWLETLDGFGPHIALESTPIDSENHLFILT